MMKLDFWNLPTKQPEEARGMDGAEWILEGCAGGRYHVAVRWSMGQEAAFTEAADYLLKLSTLTIPADEHY